MSVHCPVCGSNAVEPVIQFPNVPVLCNQLWDTEERARAAPCGKIDLKLCLTCALIWNVAFDPGRMSYDAGYENALHHSPHFRTYADALVRDLCKRYRLSGGTIVEIGCGDGYLLDRFVECGVTHARGVDPSMKGRKTPYMRRDGVEIAPRFLRKSDLDGDVGMIVCRHVLEHISDPRAFLQEIAEVLDGRSIPLYFEVPNMSWILDAPSPWDVIYEHVGYWTGPSLRTLFEAVGFSVSAVRTGYAEQFLSIEACVSNTQRPPLDGAAVSAEVARARNFAHMVQTSLDRWQALFSEEVRTGVIWGAGSKGVTFANVATSATCRLTALVDLNPLKQNRFIPATGQPVLSPSDLSDHATDLVLVSNGSYRDEIEADLRLMGLDPRIEVISQ